MNCRRIETLALRGKPAEREEEEGKRTKSRQKQAKDPWLPRISERLKPHLAPPVNENLPPRAACDVGGTEHCTVQFTYLPLGMED